MNDDHTISVDDTKWDAVDMEEEMFPGLSRPIVIDGPGKPHRVFVLGRRHKIEYLPEQDMGGNHGLYELGLSSMKINSADDEVVQASTTIHEYGHGIWRRAAGTEDEDEEEKFATLFELGVVDLLTANWKTVEALRHALTGGKG